MITIPHEILPFDKGQEYERPDEDIKKFVKSFPLGDFGIDLMVGIANEDSSSQYMPFGLSLAAEHAVDHNEIGFAAMRDIVDQEIDGHRSWHDAERMNRGAATFDGESFEALMRLAQRFEDEANYIRQVLAATPDQPIPGSR